MKALKIIGKVLLAIISVILCIALFASTLVTMLVADVKVATNKDNLQNLIQQTLSAPAQQSELRPLALAAGTNAQTNISNGGLSDALVEYAFDALNDASGGELPLTLDDVKQFVEDSTLKEFIADKSASIISDIYTGENTTNISTEEITKLVNDNKTVIKQYFDIDVTDEMVDQLNQMIDEVPVMQQIREEGVASVIVGSGMVDAEGVGEADNSVAMALDMVRTYTSDAALWLCIGVCAVLIGLLFLCAWNKPYKAMIGSGITLFLASVGFLVPTLIAWLSPATWLGLFSFEPMIGTLSRFILMLTGGVCGTVAGLGIALLAGGIVVCVLMKKKAAARKAAAVEEAVAEEVAEEVPSDETAEEAVEEVAAEEAPAEEATEEPAEEAATEGTV